MALSIGKKAPKFLLLDKDGQKTSLESFPNEKVVLYFYPKDDTPGCTLEALEFTKQLSRFKKLGVSVVGISGGDPRSKSKFCLKHSLAVPLLSDSDFSVSEAYGVYGEKTFVGRKYKGIFRSTFVVNLKSGLIEQVFDSVKPEGHAVEVLEALQGKLSAKKTPTRKSAVKAVRGGRAVKSKIAPKKLGKKKKR